MLLEAMGGDFDPQRPDEDEIVFMLEPMQALQAEIDSNCHT